MAEHGSPLNTTEALTIDGLSVVPGRLYPVIQGRLFFTAHTGRDMTTSEIAARPLLFL
jgi:hypothetical protein